MDEAMKELEKEAEKLNVADDHLRRGLAIYLDVYGDDLEYVEERVVDLFRELTYSAEQRNDASSGIDKT